MKIQKINSRNYASCEKLKNNSKGILKTLPVGPLERETKGTMNLKQRFLNSALEFRFEAHYFVTLSLLACNKPSRTHIDVNQSNLRSK